MAMIEEMYGLSPLGQNRVAGEFLDFQDAPSSERSRRRGSIALSTFSDEGQDGGVVVGPAPNHQASTSSYADGGIGVDAGYAF